MLGTLTPFRRAAISIITTAYYVYNSEKGLFRQIKLEWVDNSIRMNPLRSKLENRSRSGTKMKLMR